MSSEKMGAFKTVLNGFGTDAGTGAEKSEAQYLLTCGDLCIALLKVQRGDAIPSASGRPAEGETQACGANNDDVAPGCDLEKQMISVAEKRCRNRQEREAKVAVFRAYLGCVNGKEGILRALLDAACDELENKRF